MKNAVLGAFLVVDDKLKRDPRVPGHFAVGGLAPYPMRSLGYDCSADIYPTQGFVYSQSNKYYPTKGGVYLIIINIYLKVFWEVFRLTA